MIDVRKKEMVLALLKDKQYRPMRFREMAGLLQVPRFERGELKDSGRISQYYDAIDETLDLWKREYRLNMILR